MAAVPSEELRTVLSMFVILLTVDFKFRNRSTCSKGPMKRAGKVCGDPGRGGTPILGHIRDVRPKWVSFPGQKPAGGC